LNHSHILFNMVFGRYHDTWVNRTGPGDSRPTALQIVKDEDLVGKLGDKVIVVTGASSGIGIETVRALRVTGATLVATARNKTKADPIIEEIVKSTPENENPVHLVILDQESLDSVRAGAKEILEKSGGKINVVINNAGVMATPKGLTKDGLETQFGTNHVAHFLLFELLKPALLASSTPDFQSRVISVSSIGHRYGSVNFGDFNFERTEYSPFPAYGQSKTANIWFANELERRYGSKGLHGLSLHPGGIHTGLQQHVDQRTQEMWKNPVIRQYMKSPEQGAATSVYAAISKNWEGKGGRYLSNCEEQLPDGEAEAFTDGAGMRIGDDGYGPHAYDPESEARLWKESLALVGLEDDA
jgi:NAD(P)-dependent dehydrogenase (short-subunit alcohol dehydrogenase family)